VSILQKGLTIGVIGAGGKMGSRITANLAKTSYHVLYVESSEPGIKRIRDKGHEVTPFAEAAQISDIVVLAVPDVVLGKVSQQLLPLMKSGSIVITLDPAAAYAKQLAVREDITFTVAHPCHPTGFTRKFTEEEFQDVFGGAFAKQDIVMALQHGDVNKFASAESLAVAMFAPVEKCHRITVEQMALLEPTAAEVVAISSAVILKQTLDEIVKLGVPEEAARSFLLGHIQIGLAVSFFGTNPFSDACEIALKYGLEKIYKDDWKKVFEKEALDEVLKKMLHLEQANF